MKLRPFLDLVRVFLTPSAAADSIAGYAVAASAYGTLDPPKIAFAAAASVLLYWFGMATNDILDREKDRAAAPFRPIPSGRVRTRDAALLAIILAVSALASAAIAEAAAPAGAVLALALLYNAGGKRIPLLGSALMGGCRAGNLLIGAAAAAGLGDAIARAGYGAAILGLYTAGITAVSVLEDREYRSRRFHAAAAPLLAVPLVLGAWRPGSLGNLLNAAGLLWLLARTQSAAASGRRPVHPATAYVRGALGGIFLVDAGILWALAPPPALPWAPAAVYALGAAGWWWKRRWLCGGGPDT